MEQRYNIYFAGELMPGQEAASVRAKVARLFNADEATLEKLFSGRPMLLKKDCDLATARKYQEAMERAGARPDVRASAEKAAPLPETRPAPAPAAKPQSTAERIAAVAAGRDPDQPRQPERTPARKATGADSGLDLAPAGSDVMRPDERPAPVAARSIDTTGLDLAEAGDPLSAPRPSAPPPPDTSALTMAEPGEPIPTLPSDERPVEPDTSGLDLAAAGTDFSDCAGAEAPEPGLDLSHLVLSPAGSDVLDPEYRDRKQAEPPATDHLSLRD